MTALLSPEQAAERLHVSVKTLRRLRDDGAIRYVAVSARKIFYRPEDVAEFLEARVRRAEPCRGTDNKGKPKRRAGRPDRGGGVVVPFTARQ